MVNSLKTFLFFCSNSSNTFFLIPFPLIVHVVVLLTVLEPAVADNKYNMLILYSFKYNIQCTEV